MPGQSEARARVQGSGHSPVLLAWAMLQRLIPRITASSGAAEMEEARVQGGLGSDGDAGCSGQCCNPVCHSSGPPHTPLLVGVSRAPAAGHRAVVPWAFLPDAAPQCTSSQLGMRPAQAEMSVTCGGLARGAGAGSEF